MRRLSIKSVVSAFMAFVLAGSLAIGGASAANPKDNTNKKIRILVSVTTTAGDVTLHAGDTYAGKNGSVTMIAEGKKNAPAVIRIQGAIEELTLDNIAKVMMADGAAVKHLIATSNANGSSIEGNGSIEKSTNNANNLTFNGKPIPTGVTHPKPPTPPADPWTLNWSDEFNGDAVDPNNWVFEIGNGQTSGNPGWGNNELEYYTDRPENVKVQNGNLVITPQKENYQGFQYTSARLKTAGLFNQRYGKFEIRAKAPSGKGFWPAIWMLPQDSVYGTWAASGEIDIMENKGSQPNIVSGTLHYGEQWPNNTYTGKEFTFPNGSTTEDFHTYSLEWEPGEIRFYVDGELYQTQNDWFSKSLNQPANNSYPAPFDQPFYMILNLAIGGNFDGNPTADTVFGSSKTMEIDYVRAYTLTGRPYRIPIPPATPKENYLPGSNLPQAPDNDLVYNADYTQTLDGDAGMGIPGTAHWAFYKDPGAAGTVSIEPINGTNFAKFAITNAGGNVYSIQPQAIVSLAKGRNYKLSFDAKTDPSATRSMTVKLTGGASRGFSAYSPGLQANLSDTLEHYEMSFQMKQDSDIAARIEFNLGQNTHTAWIGNVKLVEIDSIPFDHDSPKTPLADGNHVYNGTFDQGEADRLSYWHLISSGGAAATYSVNPDERKLNVIVSNGGATVSDVLLLQKGIQLLNGHDYKLTFDASTNENRTITVQMRSPDGSVVYAAGDVDLTTSLASKTFTFSMGGATTDAAQLVFLLGGANGSLKFDNVRLERTSVFFPPDTVFYPLGNGDFSAGMNKWASAIDSGGSVSASVVGGEAKIIVAGEGSNPWSGMFFQDSLQLKGGLDYVVSFKAKASVPRKIEVDAENASYTRFFDKTFDLTTDYQTFSFEFKMLQDQQVALKFFVGLIAGTAAIGSPHDVFLDDVVFQVKNAPVAMPPTLTPDTTVNSFGQDIDITFTDNAEWRAAVSTVKINGTTLASEQYALTPGHLLLPAARFATDGNYPVVVEASGFAPTTVVQSIMASDGNLVVNGDFSNGTNNWTVWAGDGGFGTLTTDNGTGKVDIGSKGPNNWSIQLYQDGIPMTAGKTYELRLKASSTVDRPITVEFTGTSGGQKSFNLTSALTQYATTFTVNSSASLKLNFLIGNAVNGSAVTPDGAHTLTLDDISVKETTTPPPAIGHSLQNGTFDTNTDGWNLYTSDGSNAVISSDSGQLLVNFPNYDGWFQWSTIVNQDHLQLDAGKTYTLSFDASSTIDKNVLVEVLKGSSGSYLTAQPISLTSGMQHFIFNLSVGSVSDPLAKVQFLLGSNNVVGSPGEVVNPGDPYFQTHSIRIDNVALAEFVSPPAAVNVALNKSATSSGSSLQAALLAVDGNPGTRWESQFSDPQWIQVDLGAVYSVSRVLLNWEASFGKAYTIETSTDGVTWTTVYSTVASDGGFDDLSFAPVDARYVKMNGTVRALPYGYSLWEFEVYGQ